MKPIKKKLTIRNKQVFVISDTLNTIQISTLLEKVGLLEKFVIKPNDSSSDGNSKVIPRIIGIDHEYMAEGSKNMAVFKIMQAQKFAHDQMLYVDNAKAAIEYFNSIGLCRTVFVEEKAGMGEETCHIVEKMFEKSVINDMFTLENVSDATSV